MRTLSDIRNAIQGAARSTGHIAMPVGVFDDLMTHVVDMESSLNRIHNGEAFPQLIAAGSLIRCTKPDAG